MGEKESDDDDVCVWRATRSTAASRRVVASTAKGAPTNDFERVVAKERKQKHEQPAANVFFVVFFVVFFLFFEEEKRQQLFVERVSERRAGKC